MATERKFLRDWRIKAKRPFWSTPLGSRVRHIESAMLEGALHRLRGERVLWIGGDDQSVGQIDDRMVKLPIYLKHAKSSTEPAHRQGDTDPERLETRPVSKITAALDQLPFQSGSIDGVVLHHSLEEHTDPRLVLREVFRVLAPGGQLIVCGFNPWSLVGMRRLYARMVPDVMSQQRLINPIRLFDWFTLLGFELNAPPVYAGLNLWRNVASESAVKPTHHIPFGGLLVTSVTKQVNAYTFKPQRRSRQPKLAPVAYPRIAHWHERELPDSESPS